MDIDKIIDIVKKTNKEVVLLRENGDAYVVSKLEDFYKNLDKDANDYNKKSDDDYAISVKKLIMP
ncbi:MAG TPA: hypothetical protein PLD95_01330 [bacterium]|jgi:hypothetical protein|nr:hypothetical protein [bacterium]HOG38091.1 hypothetical protein [bacterium]HQI03147.1 hypothetical protein [bacterium]